MEELMENEILQDLENLYGLGSAKETLKAYIEYIGLKQTGQIENMGNFNIFIKCPERYDTSKIIDFIYKVLKCNGVINDENYYDLKQSDILHKLSNIKETMIVVADKTNFNMRSSQELLFDFIENNSNKIFVIVYKAERGTRLPRLAPIDEELFCWNINILGQYTKEEKQKYITQKLKHNNLKVNNKCNFINELSKMETISKIDNELLYIAVKSKANNVHTITDKFLQQIHRPQYITKQKANGKSAMNELDEMIGLEPIKKQIKQIVNYVKINKSRGQLPMLHMALLGPSGVGKTECARLVARIFYEEGILSKDNFIEASRVDLVGAYIGHTAIQTQKVINSALGGTLLIDEAYALDPKGSGKDFGAESISTLIKAMEDHRQELCVILTGYEQPMEDLLKSNSGFSSRIQFKLHFKDYTPDELYQIFKKMVKDDKYKLDKNSKPLLVKHFKEIKNQENFGNARYIRSMLEKIKMEQAQRVAEDTAADIDLIKAVDIKNVIEYLNKKKPKERLQIGFATAI